MFHCFQAYDDENYRKWFLSQSGIPMQQGGNLGNPEACVAGGHVHYYAFVKLGLEYNDGSADKPKRVDAPAEFGLCMPAQCTEEVVATVMMPFYLGPHLGLPWGPKNYIGSKVDMYTYIHISYNIHVYLYLSLYIYIYIYIYTYIYNREINMLCIYIYIYV